jgi:hypothetical protein
MSETQPQLERAPDVHTYHYPPPVPCTECGGAGKITLLVTARPCAACEGSGRVQPEPRHEVTPGPLGYYRRERSFDEEGRLISECHWFEVIEEVSPETRNAKPEIRKKFQGGNEEMEA